jgi:hypothetical protein
MNLFYDTFYKESHNDWRDFFKNNNSLTQSLRNFKIYYNLILLESQMIQDVVNKIASFIFSYESSFSSELKESLGSCPCKYGIYWLKNKLLCDNLFVNDGISNGLLNLVMTNSQTFFVEKRVFNKLDSIFDIYEIQIYKCGDFFIGIGFESIENVENIEDIENTEENIEKCVLCINGIEIDSNVDNFIFVKSIFSQNDSTIDENSKLRNLNDSNMKFIGVETPINMRFYYNEHLPILPISSLPWNTYSLKIYVKNNIQLKSCYLLYSHLTNEYRDNIIQKGVNLTINDHNNKKLRIYNHFINYI